MALNLKVLSQSTAAVKKYISKKEGLRNTRMCRIMTQVQTDACERRFKMLTIQNVEALICWH